MALYDVNKGLREFDKLQQAPIAQDVPKPGAPEEKLPAAVTRAEELADNEIGDTSREREIRNAQSKPADEAAERQAVIDQMNGRLEKEKDAAKIVKSVPEFQSAISAAVRGSLVLGNVQAMIAVRNQANIRRGMGKDPGEALRRQAGKGQFSTVAIPSALVRRVAQEIGPLSSRTSQNDMMTGFLYWYFGQPDGVPFQSPESEEKVQEIVENLGMNAAPVRAAQMNYNMSGSLLERMDEIKERMDAMAALIQILSRDSLGIKSRSDKSYIAISYVIMNLLMFTPPVSPGQNPSDIDMMGGGNAWGLMAAIDEAYEYFKNTNGREIYKTRHGVKAQVWQPPKRPLVQPAPDDDDYPIYGSGQQPGKEDEDMHQDEDYEDIPADFDPFEDDFDDMGVGMNYVPQYALDENYDDGVEEGSREWLAHKREEQLMRERIAKMEVSERINGDGGAS